LRRFPQWALAASVLVLTACSPACTPPEAKNPEASKGGGGDGGAPAREPEAEAAGDDDEGKPSVPPGEMITEARGVDLTKLKESQRSTFFQIVNSEPSACSKTHSLAKSLRDDATCRDSLIAAQFVADYLAAGAPTSEVRDALQVVFADLKPREIPVEGRPTLGSERAPVTVVVFADFECPHCKQEAPVVREAVEQFRGRAKLVFKHFPLQLHPRAKVAAAAAEAAHLQGKFWPMHDIIFANQDALDDEDLVGYASKLGLDVGKFKADFKAAAQMAAVEQDKAHGEEAGVDGTPAVFVNGRRANGRYALFGGSVAGWIDDALKR
jgi:protein-disulfide isomerase